MLSKLLKYEFKATGRTFGLCYVALALIAVVSGLLNFNAEDFINAGMAGSLMMMAFAGLTVAVFVVTFVLSITRFTKNLLGGEGYLMNTLPVSSYNLVASKVIASIVWCICSGLVCILSSSVLVFLSTGGSGLDLQSFLADLSIVFMQTGIMQWGSILLNLLTLLVCGICSILIIYAGIMLGRLLPKLKVAASILVIIVAENLLINGVSFLTTALGISGLSGLLCGTITLVVLLIVGAGLFIATAQMLGRRLNLE